MNKEERDKRINELLDKEDFSCEDYVEVKNLISESEKEYYEMRRRFQEVVYRKL